MCYRTRRRIGAYLDQALDERESSRASVHIASCSRCHAEVEGLRRLSAMLRQGVPAPALPDWTGFWEGIRRGVEDRRVERPARFGRRPRLVAAAAGAAALVVAAVMWQSQQPPLTARAAGVISVSSADTDHPGGTVMVYTAPERDLAVVWVFAPED